MRKFYEKYHDKIVPLYDDSLKNKEAAILFPPNERGPTDEKENVNSPLYITIKNYRTNKKYINEASSDSEGYYRRHSNWRNFSHLRTLENGFSPINIYKVRRESPTGSRVRSAADFNFRRFSPQKLTSSYEKSSGRNNREETSILIPPAKSTYIWKIYDQDSQIAILLDDEDSEIMENCYQEYTNNNCLWYKRLKHLSFLKESINFDSMEINCNLSQFIPLSPNPISPEKDEVAEDSFRNYRINKKCSYLSRTKKRAQGYNLFDIFIYLTSSLLQCNSDIYFIHLHRCSMEYQNIYYDFFANKEIEVIAIDKIIYPYKAKIYELTKSEYNEKNEVLVPYKIKAAEGDSLSWNVEREIVKDIKSPIYLLRSQPVGSYQYSISNTDKKIGFIAKFLLGEIKLNNAQRIGNPINEGALRERYIPYGDASQLAAPIGYLNSFKDGDEFIVMENNQVYIGYIVTFIQCKKLTTLTTN